MIEVVRLFKKYLQLSREINRIADRSYSEVAGGHGSWLGRRRFRKVFKRALEEGND